MFRKSILLLSVQLLIGTSSAETPKEFLSEAVQFPLPSVKLSLPQGVVFEFCVVPLQIGDAAFAMKEFWLGGRGAGGFKEPPTRSMLAGSVVLKIDKKPDWCILIGKTEVTVVQWHGVLGTLVPPDTDGQLPITKVSRADVALFIEKLNEQMRKQPIGQTIASPFEGTFTDPFLRLPSEAEWEFAARGGVAVDSNKFDKPTPYDGELNRYEWFFGQDSSKGKLKQVGLLKPNPLGLCDMLGNVSEMAESLYQIEYSQGRIGGSVIRGGDFRTEEADLRSSMRVETPWVFPDGTAYRNGTVGFRLAVGSLVVSSMAGSEKLETEWERHLNMRTQPAAASPSNASVSETSGKELEEISELTKSLAKKLELGATDELTTKQTLALMEVRTANIRGSMKKADAYFAMGAVRLSSIISQDSVSTCAKILQAREMLNDPDLSDDLKAGSKLRIGRFEKNLREASLSIEGCLKMFGEIPRDAVDVAFDEHLKKIEDSIAIAEDVETKGARKRQIDATKVARKISMEYLSNRRIDLDEWKAGMYEIAKTWVDRLKASE